METEYIEKGRYEYPTLWIKEFKPLASYGYPTLADGSLVVLNIGQALDLWKALTIGLVKAGQAGTLNAGNKQFVLTRS